MLLDAGLEDRLLDRSHDRIHVLAVLEEEQGRNRAHVEAHRGPRIGVHVHLGEPEPAGVGRRDGPAGAAPLRPEVHQNQSLALFHVRAEALVGDVGDGAVRAHVRPLLVFPWFACPTRPASRTSVSPCRTSRRPSRSTATSWASRRARSRSQTARKSSRSRSARARSSCSPPAIPPAPLPASSSGAAQGSITSATASPISIAPSTRAAAQATGWSTTSPGPARAGAG